MASGHDGTVNKAPPKNLNYGIIRAERGQEYAVKISHDSNA